MSIGLSQIPLCSCADLYRQIASSNPPELAVLKPSACVGRPRRGGFRKLPRREGCIGRKHFADEVRPFRMSFRQHGMADFRSNRSHLSRAMTNRPVSTRGSALTHQIANYKAQWTPRSRRSQQSWQQVPIDRRFRIFHQRETGPSCSREFRLTARGGCIGFSTIDTMKPAHNRAPAILHRSGNVFAL